MAFITVNQILLIREFIYLCIELGDKIEGAKGVSEKKRKDWMGGLSVGREGGAETHGTNILVTLALRVFLEEV